MGIKRIDLDTKRDSLRIQDDQPDRQVVYVPLDIKYGGFTKIVKVGDSRYYQSFMAALADAVAGDRILVASSVPITAVQTISVSDIHITFLPNAGLSGSGSMGFGVNITGGNVCIEGLYISGPGPTFTSATINITGSDVELMRAKVVNSSGVMPCAYSIQASALRTFIIGSCRLLGGSITSRIANAGTDTDASIRG